MRRLATRRAELERLQQQSEALAGVRPAHADDLQSARTSLDRQFSAFVQRCATGTHKLADLLDCCSSHLFAGIRIAEHRHWSYPGSQLCKAHISHIWLSSTGAPLNNKLCLHRPPSSTSLQQSAVSALNAHETR